MATLPSFIVVGGSGSGLLPVGSSAGSLQPFDERPIGTYDGVNTVFTLSHTPFPQIVLLDVAGSRQAPRTSPDGSAPVQYTLSGNTITFTDPPKPSDYVNAFYFYKGTGPGGVRSGKARLFGSGGFAQAVGQFLPTTAQLTVKRAVATAGDTLTVGIYTYTFVSTLNNAVANQILASISRVNVAQAIVRAINSGGDGVTVSTPTTPNIDVTATLSQVAVAGAPVGASDAVVTVTAVFASPDNQIALTTTSSVMSWNVSLMGNGTVSGGDTITIGARTYTFVGVLNNAVANQVLAIPPLSGGVAPALADVLANAINAGFGSGTQYSSATTANTQVSAASGPNNTVTITALIGGSAGNSIAVSESTGTPDRFTWNGSTLSGGTGGSASVGSADEVNYGNSSRFAIITDLTIVIWVKLPSNATGAIINYGQNATGSATNTTYSLRVSGSSGAWSIDYFHDYGSGGAGSIESHTFSANLANDTWYALFLVRDIVAKTVILYSAQVGDTSLTTVGTFSYTNNPSGGGDPGSFLCLGLYPDSVVDNPLTGTIEEHYIWNRTLSTDELLVAMQGNPSLSSMVVGSYMGDNPEKDISGNGASGTVTGTTLVQGHG